MKDLNQNTKEENNMNKFEILISDMKKQRQEMAPLEAKLHEMENSYKELSNKYSSEIRNAISIMNKVEHKVLKELNVYGYYAIPSEVNSYKIIGIKNDMLKIQMSVYVGEGEYGKRRVKIPLRYFEMENNEIEKGHTEWSMNYIIKKEEKRKVK